MGPDSSVTVTNEFGPVSVKGVPGRQITISARPHSNKVEVEASHNGDRVEVTSHQLERTSDSDAAVDYEISVPPECIVTVRAPSGPITAQHLWGDVIVEGEAAKIDVRDIRNAHVHVRSVTGPITLTNITNGHVEVTSVNGDVQLTNVDGRKVTVNTTRGNIRYAGDFGSGGAYMLVNYSGDIDVVMPPTASVDLSARSVSGQVQQDFPMQQTTHPSFTTMDTAHSFAGTSNSGASSVRLRSFSGKIRVKKQ
ncbi:MAG: DUF4097 family beta strand repeat protein [Acidobacteria bacterium]|nr:DUF4097 family beta strand repeat protein [Acidobacteriota bacterium]